jgi:hypothetical protein
MQYSIKINLKILVVVTLLLGAIISCQEKKITQKTRISTTKDSEKIVKADINFMSNPLAKKYKTIITEKYKKLEVNFSSYYVLISWGCGSGCVTGAMVDVRDGFVYAAPIDKDWGGNGTYMESNKESEILKTVLVNQFSKEKIEKIIKFWVWNENLKKFKFLKEKSSLVKNQSDQINFNKILNLQDVEFNVSTIKKEGKNTLTIFTFGLQEKEYNVTFDIEGEIVVDAEVEDLNSDGSPELFVFTRSVGSGSYANVYAFSVNNNKSMSKVYFQPTAENTKINKGYMGHDEFSIVENSLGQRFPLYKKGDINANPTGGTRQVSYKLIDGEASRKLVVDKVSDYK